MREILKNAPYWFDYNKNCACQLGFSNFSLVSQCIHNFRFSTKNRQTVCTACRFLFWKFNSVLDKQKRKRNEELRKIICHVIDDYHKARFGIEHTFALVVGGF